MSAPAVTIVIPTRNRLGFLREAVESVQAQTLRAWELLIVDDASDDGTWAWLETLEDPRIRKVRLGSHSERSAARNRGLAEARGEFILFLDDDDRLRPRALERLVAPLRRRPEVIAAVGDVVSFDARGNRRRGLHIRLPGVRSVRREVLLGWAAWQGQCLLRTDSVRRSGGWNEGVTVAEDHDLWLRLSGRGPVAFILRTVLERRVHAGQWRRANTRAIEDECRNAHVAALVGDARSTAERYLKAGALRRLAAEAHREGDFSRAIVALARAIWQAPALLGSPVIGANTARLLVTGGAGLLLGRAATRVLRNLVGRARQRLGRDPQPSA